MEAVEHQEQLRQQQLFPRTTIRLSRLGHSWTVEEGAVSTCQPKVGGLVVGGGAGFDWGQVRGVRTPPNRMVKEGWRAG